MVYILNKNFQENRKALQSIMKLYGLGFYLSKIMFNDLNIGFNSKIKDLSQNILVKIPKWIEKNKIFLDSTLKNKVFSDISNLISMKSYRGLRHLYSLPARGQRTKTNSKTVKKLNFYAYKNKKFKKI